MHALARQEAWCEDISKNHSNFGVRDVVSSVETPGRVCRHDLKKKRSCHYVLEPIRDNTDEDVEAEGFKDQHLLMLYRYPFQPRAYTGCPDFCHSS
ncbi:hypothetical protein NC653_019008 [Populus alba x Populus x berolinensis]|uniref:Uncharacterized protein n=1 Tax=Populus alba x Populus x berolinensis TaxID=444605 RepID=A0AAD6QHR4_9ROSI|nr:hypothetical protein NC653_019008 [Populus alba x Populus x berolinensis]